MSLTIRVRLLTGEGLNCFREKHADQPSQPDLAEQIGRYLPWQMGTKLNPNQ